MREEVKILLVIVGVAAIISTLSWLIPGYWGSDMGPHMCGWWGWPMVWWMPLGLIAFWVFVGLGVYLIVRGLGSSGADVDKAMEILRGRYARGEITPEEYEEMRRRLSSK